MGQVNNPSYAIPGRSATAVRRQPNASGRRLVVSKLRPRPRRELVLVTEQPNTDVRAAIDVMVQQLVETRDVDQALSVLTAGAVGAIPHVDFASVSRHVV